MQKVMKLTEYVDYVWDEERQQHLLKTRMCGDRPVKFVDSRVDWYEKDGTVAVRVVAGAVMTLARAYAEERPDAPLLLRHATALYNKIAALHRRGVVHLGIDAHTVVVCGGKIDLIDTSMACATVDCAPACAQRSKLDPTFDPTSARPDLLYQQDLRGAVAALVTALFPETESACKELLRRMHAPGLLERSPFPAEEQIGAPPPTINAITEDMVDLYPGGYPQLAVALGAIDLRLGRKPMVRLDPTPDMANPPRGGRMLLALGAACLLALHAQQ